MSQADDCRNCKLCRLNQLFVLNHDSHLYGSETTPSKVSPANMASEAKNRNIDRTLRFISLWIWCPAIVILLPHGILTKQVFPALGILPMTLSAVGSVVHITVLHLGYRKASRGCSAELLFDFFSAVFHIAVLITTWILISEYNCSWRRGNFYCTPRMVMLGTTGTMFMIINFLIHSWLVLRDVFCLLRSFRWQGGKQSLPRTCPHCDGDLSSGSKRQRHPLGVNNKHMGDTSKHTEEETGEADVDDDNETARLL